MSQAHPLDNPERASLLGPHAHFAERLGDVVRYPPDVMPFLGLPDVPDAGTWRNIAALVGAGNCVPVPRVEAAPPPHWSVVMDGWAVQLVGPAVQGQDDAEACVLTTADVPEMIDLVARTEPGPFGPRTIELGSYLGIRRDGRLVAMAGERLHPPGWTEISAVCTDESVRRQGLARRLVLAVAARISSRGDRPFLHVEASKTGAIRLYESLGFVPRQRVRFRVMCVPDAGAGPEPSATDPTGS